MLMDFAAGGTGAVEISLSPTTGDARSVGIQGVEGSAEWDGGEVLRLRRMDVDEVVDVAVPPAPETRHAHFFRWIREHRAGKPAPTPEVDADAGYHALEIGHAFLACAEDGVARVIR